MGIPVQLDRTFRLGSVEVDPVRRCIRRGDDIITVEPKPFDLLLYLVRHHDRVVRREELMESLWPEVVVSEDTLSSAVRRVRDALGPERHRIQVLRKVGYRLLAPSEIRSSKGALDTADQGSGTANSLFSTANLEGAATPFVGRAAELAFLIENLDAGLAGQGCFIALAGDAGTGKSRTATELARRAHANGAEIIHARCYEGEGTQPFWPWVQAFRCFAAGRSPTQLAEVLGAEATDIALLTAAAAAHDSSPPADPMMLRARLFDSAVTVLRRSAQRQPILLLVDDLHWADAASIMLLRSLVDEIADVPMVIVGTYREFEVDTDHPLAAMLSALRRRRTLRHISLGRMHPDEVATLLHSLAGAVVDERVVAAVYAATEGNPLFVREYWHDLVETESVICEASGWRAASGIEPLNIPSTVSEIIRRRLRRLPREAVQLLATAAVIGREFTYEMVRLVTRFTETDIITFLEDAAMAGIIEDLPAAAGSYRFTHALIRQGLYESMTAMRRAALHRAVGEALQELYRPNSGPDRLAELAHHFLNGAPAGSSGPAIDYAVQAALAATHACAYEEAVRYLRHAVLIWDQRKNPGVSSEPQRRCELQLLLAEALGRAGDGSGMRAAFDDATGQARALPAPALMARAAIGMTGYWVAEDEAAVSRLEDALVALPSGDLGLRARTSARLAKTLYFFANTRERREQLCSQARALATSAADTHALAEVFADSLEALFHGDSLPQQDELTEMLGEAANAAADKRLRLVSGAWRVVNSMRHGKLNEADAHLAAFTHLAHELRQARFLHHAAAFDAALLLARAKLEGAAKRIDEALALGLRIDEASARWIHWAQLYHLRREQGRLAEFLGEGLALRLPSGTLGALSHERTSRWAAPHVFCELGREEEARASFDALIANGFDAIPPENARNVRIPVLFSLGDACVTIGNEKAAVPLYELLAPYADQWQVVGWGSVVFASTHLMLGALRSVQKQWNSSVDHFEEALRQHESQNAICAQARLLYQYARGIRRRGRRVDHAHSARLIAAGLKIAQEHGLPGIALRLQRLKASG